MWHILIVEYSIAKYDNHFLYHTHSLTLTLPLSLPPSLPHSLPPSLPPSLSPSLPPSFPLPPSLSFPPDTMPWTQQLSSSMLSPPSSLALSLLTCSRSWVVRTGSGMSFWPVVSSLSLSSLFGVFWTLLPGPISPPRPYHSPLLCSLCSYGW